MRKFIIISPILLFYIYGLYAQEWAPIGAKWYYTTPGEGSFVGLHIFESVGDTLIKDDSCRIIKKYDINAYSTGPYNYYWDTVITTNYMYYDQGIIYHFDPTIDDFYALYDFTVNEGDTVIVRSNFYVDGQHYNKFEHVVDSIGIIELTGHQLKKLYAYATVESDWLYCHVLDTIHPIIENIGSTINLLGLPAEKYAQAIGNHEFRCYLDKNIEYRPGKYKDIPCDTLPELPTAVSSHDEEAGINIYPNPFEEYIVVTSQILNMQIEIYDLYGKRVVREEFDGTNTLELGDLASGLYFLKIVTSSYNKPLTKKIIKK